MLTHIYELIGLPNRIFAHNVHHTNTLPKICDTVKTVFWKLIRYSTIHFFPPVIVFLSQSSLMLYVQTRLVFKQICVYKCQSLIKHHTMKVYRVWRHSSTYSTLHTTLPLYTQANSLLYPLSKRLGGPQNWSWRFGEAKKKKSCLRLELNPRSPRRPTSSLVTVPNESIVTDWRNVFNLSLVWSNTLCEADICSLISGKRQIYWNDINVSNLVCPRLKW